MSLKQKFHYCHLSDSVDVLIFMLEILFAMLIYKLWVSACVFLLFELASKQSLVCGDLGINSKNSQPDIDSSAARYKMYKRVATHKAPRIHPVKIRKKKNNKM